MADAVLPAPPVAQPAASSDEWRARDRFERDLLQQVRRVDWRGGKERLAVIKWNGHFVIVLPAEQA